MHLADTTWPDAGDLDTDLALLPVGSTEQHGPHAPLSTDTLSAEAFAEAAAEAYDEDIAIAPALPYGISEEHRHFAGTLWLSPDTFRDVVREVIESLAHHGWNRVILVNGHGGNTDALREIAADVTRSGDAVVVSFTWFDVIDTADIDGVDTSALGHAGPIETSMLRHHRPDLVRDERLDEATAGASDGWGTWVSRTNLAYDSVEFTENGVVGDPTDATAEAGATLTEWVADALVDLIDAVEDR